MKTYFYVIGSMLCFMMACSPKTTTTKTRTQNQSTTATFMTSREANMIDEVNLVRTDPQGYIAYVEIYIKEQEALKKQLTSGQEYVADEIKTAKELIRELKKTPKTTSKTTTSTETPNAYGIKNSIFKTSALKYSSSL